MNVKNRLLEFVSYNNMTVKQFEEICGMSNGYISSMRKGIGTLKLENVLSSFPELNREWLLYNEGEMLKSTTQVAIIETEGEFLAAKSNGLKLIPEVDFKFSAGSARLVSSERINRYWYLPDCIDCEAVSPVVGNSMMPTYPSGCYVALKRLHFEHDRINEIPYGNVFGVVVEDRFTGEYSGHIKILRRHIDREFAKSYVIAHSVNEAQFDDFDIPVSQIRSLWVVKQHIVNHIL